MMNAHEVTPVLPVAVGPSAEEIVALRPWIEEKLRRHGVRPADLPDVCQDVVFTTYTTVAYGNYRPEPAQDPADVLRAWVYGILQRLASHYRQKAWVRREIPSGLGPCMAIDPHRRYEARSDLFILRHLGRNDRAMLIARADGDTIAGIAKDQGVPRLSISRRIRRSRRIVEAIIDKGVVR